MRAKPGPRRHRFERTDSIVIGVCMTPVRYVVIQSVSEKVMGVKK